MPKSHLMRPLDERIRLVVATLDKLGFVSILPTLPASGDTAKAREATAYRRRCAVMRKTGRGRAK